MSIKTEQVASVIHRALAEVISRGLSDPRIRGLVSVTHVDVSPDLRDAFVHIAVVPDVHEKLTLEGLQAANRHLHATISKKIALRVVPHLEFRLDKESKKRHEFMMAMNEARERSGLDSDVSDEDVIEPSQPSTDEENDSGE